MHPARAQIELFPPSSKEPRPRVDPRRDRLLEAHARLCLLYEAPIRFFSTKDPLSELVSAMLSHRTRNASSGKAYRALRAALPTWEQVRDAPTEEVERAIVDTTWPEQKAPRIQDVLRRISAERGALSLEFLGEMPEAQARAWLERLPGVGPKTSAAVLLFSHLRRKALPVDSHHFRVATRLGVLLPGTELVPAHRLLEDMLPTDWDAQTVYDHHEVLMLHGQRVCHYQTPACERCVLLDICDEGQRRTR